MMMTEIDASRHSRESIAFSLTRPGLSRPVWLALLRHELQRLMWLTGLLQSLWPVLPPRALTSNT